MFLTFETFDSKLGLIKPLPATWPLSPSATPYRMKTLLPLALVAAFLTGCASVQTHTSPKFASTYAEQIYNESELTVAHRIVNLPPVKRPRSLSGNAQTVLSLIITPDGSIVIEDVISQTDGPFTLAAIEAVKAAKFYPGRLNGHPVATRIALTLSYGSNHHSGMGYPNDEGSAPFKMVDTPSYDISPK